MMNKIKNPRQRRVRLRRKKSRLPKFGGQAKIKNGSLVLGLVLVGIGGVLLLACSVCVSFSVKAFAFIRPAEGQIDLGI